VALFGLDTEVLLADTEGAANGYFALERSIYNSKRGRSLLAKVIAQDAGKKGVSITRRASASSARWASARSRFCSRCR